MKELLTALMSFVLTTLIGLWLIPFLRRVKAGQTILEIGPNWHKSKQGTPTMGGFMFMVGSTAAVAIAAIADSLLNARDAESFRVGLFILAFGWVFGLIGFADDWSKVRRKRNQGLTAIQKLMLQAAAAAAFMAYLRYFNYLTPEVTIPFTDFYLPLPWVVFMAFGVILICGMVNAVNLTDGIDGLCAGVSLPVMLFFVAAAFLRGGVSVTAAAVAGGLGAFLMYNRHPAKVFMGDTGSLFLGGMVCGLSFACNDPVIMIIVGLVYIIEMFSVIFQVGYFKITKKLTGSGKRLFKMAPLHHHLEKSGWSEVKIGAVCASVTAALCAAAYFGGR